KPLNRPGGSGTYRYESDDLVSGYSEIATDQFVPYEGARTCPVSRVFGSTGGTKCWVEESLVEQEELERREAASKLINDVNHLAVRGRNAPARLIVRDCHLTEESVKLLKAIDTGLNMTEWKFENGMDRITAAANPRQIERVPAGAKFQFELVYTVENPEQALEDLRNLAIAIAILEDDALGGHGSRGYGKVRFENFEFYYRGSEQYGQLATGTGNFHQAVQTVADTTALLERFGELTTTIQGLLPGDSTGASA
ncbi:MAG: type III-A CRISPR-associated RAMP protein Csm3, partial [Elainella sp.]